MLAAIRAQRHREWGQELRAALTANEERLLATILELASEPEQDNVEIAITINELTNRLSSKATLRVSLRRLVDRGYLVEGWYRGMNEPVRAYSPTC